MNNRDILCVEDNMQVQAFNKTLLEAKGFTVRIATKIGEAREAVKSRMPGLIILDIRLPDGNGLDFLRELRRKSDVPVIALTNNREEQDIIEGLASGCDDYVPKPYAFPVLYARIESLLRRSERVPEVIVKGLLRLEPMAQMAYLNGVDLLLTQKEFAVLLALVQNEGTVMSIESLYKLIWKAPVTGDKRALRRQISNLRIKLEEAHSGYTINTVYGEGYCFIKI